MTNDTKMVSFITMKLLTREADYAVRALCSIAANNGKVTAVSELTYSLGVPRPFMRKIMMTMTKRGIVASTRGVGGGFRMACPSSEVTVLDVIKAFQGEFSINECCFKKRKCPETARCALMASVC